MTCASCESGPPGASVAGGCDCEALVTTGKLVGGPPPPGVPGRPMPTPNSRPGLSAGRPSLPVPRPPVPTATPAPDVCRCGALPDGACYECSRPVCDEHSEIWRGWRICDRDLAKARIAARARAAEAEVRAREAAAAAAAERERQRTTVLDLAPAEAFELLYVQQRRTEQEIRSAVHVLRRLPPAAFTQVSLDVLPGLATVEKGSRRGVRRLRGWTFAGPHRQQRSWFLSRSGHWYRSGAYGHARAKDGSSKRVRLDDTERRAVIHDLARQQELNALDLQPPVSPGQPGQLG